MTIASSLIGQTVWTFTDQGPDRYRLTSHVVVDVTNWNIVVRTTAGHMVYLYPDWCFGTKGLAAAAAILKAREAAFSYRQLAALCERRAAELEQGEDGESEYPTPFESIIPLEQQTA